MYKADIGWRCPAITKVKITKITEDAIWCIENNQERRIQKLSTYKGYFNTFKEAKDFINSHLTIRLNKSNKIIIDIQNKLYILNKITEDSIK